MCIICSSPKGAPQPTEETLCEMFRSNPHGAGYMTARNGSVEISKGFLSWIDFRNAVLSEGFTAEDPVVYHFRISTQAGTTAQMTHPFPISPNLPDMLILETACELAAAHNGVIRLTSNPRERKYSDTAHYIAEFLCHLVRNPEDMQNAAILEAIERTTESKWALMDGDGNIATVGYFIESGGCFYSNETFRPHRYFAWDNSAV